MPALGELAPCRQIGRHATYIKDSGPDLDPAVRLLVGNYCRFAVDRAWFYYPDALSAELLSPEPRNGHVDPSR